MATAKKNHEALEVLSQQETEHYTAVLKVSSDKLKLFLDCTPKPSSAGTFTRAVLDSLIPPNISQRFVHDEVLDDICQHLNKSEEVKERRIAKGLPPGEPRPGRLLLLVKAYNKKPNSSECIDPWFIKHFDNIEAGLTVARLYGPQPGIAGTNVFGEPILSEPGKPVALVIDDSLKIETEAGHDFQSIIAQQTGYLEANGSSLKVITTLVIDGDVDQRIGDIDFIGSVKIKGSVMKDFRIVARGDIEVLGNVVGATLISKANITIKGHACGSANQNITITENVGLLQIKRSNEHQFPTMRAAGTFKASVVDGVVVDAIGDIEIAKEARASYLHTRSLFRTPQGTLIGGEVHSACGAEAKYMGSTSGCTTLIILSSDIESTPEYVALLEQIRAHDSAEEMLRLYLGPYAEKNSRIQLLKPDHRKKMEVMKTKLASVLGSKAKLNEERETLLRTAKHNRVYRVNIGKHAYAGVRIQSGEVMYTLEEGLDGPKTIEFLPAEQRFEVKDPQPLECSLEEDHPQQEASP